MPVFVDHKLKLTYDDLKEIPEDDPYSHEIIDGMHVASPSPTSEAFRIWQLRF